MRDLLRRARDEEGLTLDELAAQTGVDRMIIHRVENTRKYPDYEPELATVLKIIAGLRSPLTDIFVDSERLPALFNQQSRKDLPHGAVKPDNPGSPPRGPNGDQFSHTDDKLSDAIGLLGDEIINALNRINTTFSSVDRRLESIDGKLESLRAGRAADHGETANRSAHASRQRPRGTARSRKTG